MTRKQQDAAVDRVLKVSFLLNSGFTIAEFIVGLMSGSLALMADAGHNLADSVSMLISYIARHVAKRPANERKTYGYGRINIVAAAVNALILFGVAGYVLFEAWTRFQVHHDVDGSAVSWIALIGIAVNIGIAALLYANKRDLNVRSLYLNMAMDAVALVGTLIAGLLVVVTGNSIFDPIIGLLIGGMLLVTAWQIIWEALKVFLEAVPGDVDFFGVQTAIRELSFVRGVDDLHIWSITSDELSLSCHVQLAASTHVERAAERVAEIEDLLQRKFGIAHATIKVESEPCEPENVHHPDLAPPQE